jgi:hypothetical protein
MSPLGFSVLLSTRNDVGLPLGYQFWGSS